MLTWPSSRACSWISSSEPPSPSIEPEPPSSPPNPAATTARVATTPARAAHVPPRRLRSVIRSSRCRDCRLVLGPPLQPQPAPLPRQHVARGLLEVLRQNLELTASFELDVVPRHRPDVGDVAHGALLHVRARGGLRALLEHVDLLGSNRRALAVALDHVGDPHETGDELAPGMLVHLRRGTD